MCVVHHPVEDGVGQGGVADGGVPLRHRQLADDGDRRSPVAPVHQFQQIVAVDRLQRSQPEVVDDDQLHRAEPLHDPEELTGGARLCEQLQQRRHPQIAHAAVEQACGVTDGARQVGLSAAARPGDQQVLAAPDPVALAELGDLSPLQVASVAVVHIVERRRHPEPGGPDQPLLAALPAALDLVIHQQRQPLGERKIVVGAGLLHLMLQRLGHRAQRQPAKISQYIVTHRSASRSLERRRAAHVLMILRQLECQLALVAALQIGAVVQDPAEVAHA